MAFFRTDTIVDSTTITQREIRTYPTTFREETNNRSNECEIRTHPAARRNTKCQMIYKTQTNTPRRRIILNREEGFVLIG